ncbi:hypothetical protein DSF71_13655 [Salmonella enterica subsp. enterica serovar Hvittingfoss]|nr:hypothetical protein [Salmonella enterica subsp. enterica serovar Hvittingfoss]
MSINMLKKTAALLGITAGAVMSVPAMAEVVNFSGVIAPTTCVIMPVTSAGASVTNIDLGTVAKSELATGKKVEFSLASADNSQCSQTDARITWTGAGLGASGISNTNGSATNVILELAPVAGGNPIVAGGVPENGVIKQGSNTVVYKAARLDQPYKYTATLKAENVGQASVEGDFTSAVSYTVAYN